MFRMILISLVSVFIFSCSDGGDDSNFLTDVRDGQLYRIVKIGNLTWTAQNMNYKIETRNSDYNSWCYDYNEQNCKKYGRLYSYSSIDDACPLGWHLPRRTEWEYLIKAAGGESVAGKKLKSKTSGDGIDEFGFSALLGGYGNINLDDSARNSFSVIDEIGYWWSATGGGGGFGYYNNANFFCTSSLSDSFEYCNFGSYFSGNAFSVRCVKD